MSKPTKKNKVLRGLLENIGYIIVVVVSVFLINTFVMQRTEVSGKSMYPTLDHGQNLIVNKLSYRFGEPERFDIVVFEYLYKDGRYLIKRVIGLPGETVQIADNIIYINGEPLEEDYGYEPIENPGRAAELITLGEDEYFVLGDNRNYSSDSRSADVANVHKSQIVGKTAIRIWPIKDIGTLKHQ